MSDSLRKLNVGDIVLVKQSRLACRIHSINNRKANNIGIYSNRFFLEFPCSQVSILSKKSDDPNALCLTEWDLLSKEMKLVRIQNALDHAKADWHESFLKEVSKSTALIDAVVNELIRLVQRGVTRWGMKTVFEYLRHQSAVSDSDTTFKINNNSASGMARLAALLFPEVRDMFQFRNALGNDERAA